MQTITRGTILENTYEIIEEIGSGGGGVVFRARHLRLQTDVVIKKIKDEVRGKVKSRQEADILKNLKHPYLPRVYDFIETEDGVYTVMDFILGEDMSEAVKKHGGFSEKQVRKWAEQLGEALDYLHSRKPAIIHSDIKPANIMLTQDDNICLIDFNISLAMGETMESAVGISVGFSPPEQYRDHALYERITNNYTRRRLSSVSAKDDSKTALLPEVEDERTALLSDTEDDRTELLSDEDNDRTELLSDAEEVRTKLLSDTDGAEAETPKGHTSKYIQYLGKGIDARSDIYSLGMTLIYMLAGIEPPVDFDRKISLAEINMPISEGFAVILEKMTEPDPAGRYQNGAAFLKAVRNCYKLDHRYVAMYRRETGIRIAALVCLFTGILAVLRGMYQIRWEKNDAYYGMQQQAVEAMHTYDYEEAGALLEEMKSVSKERIDAYAEEVHLLFLDGDYEECISRGESYINTMPFQVQEETDQEQLANIYYVVGNAYFELQDYANAVKLFAGAQEHYTQNGLYYRDYAIALAKMGQIENAEKALEGGINRDLGQDSIYMAQGEIAHVRKQYETAVECLRRTIETTEDMQMKKRAILLCTDVYKEMGETTLDEEIALLEQYTEQFEGNGSLVMTEYLAEAYVRKAKSDETQAQTYYSRALDLFLSIYDQGYVTYQLQENMAILYENMKKFDDAEKLLLEMAESYPDRYEVYKRLAYLEADRQQEKENIDRDYQQMLVYYEQAVERYSGKEQDMEMEMLEIMMQEITDGGWL